MSNYASPLPPLSTEELVHQARLAVKAGNRPEARRLLQEAARQSPQDYRIWLWLASVAATPQASLEYVQRAERLRPGDARVAQARAWAEERLAESEPLPITFPVTESKKVGKRPSGGWLWCSLCWQFFPPLFC
ncbi:MAG: tetratricopeptide repeat protein [Anaerolineae bacterium]|nr:tetratricopeptide repeat protein [Anaerolineae bacterium]